MTRLLYTLLFRAALPLIWLRLYLKGRKQPEYLQHTGERRGFYTQSCDRPLIWIHAVSVGETRAAEPLVRALQTKYPDYQLLMTGMTPTGREAGQKVYGDAVLQAYLPYDTPGAIRRFLDHFQPRLSILMETEIWPNLLAACRQRGIPVILANARLSAESARGYEKLGRLARDAFTGLSGAAAQTEEDAQRLRSLGVSPAEVCGNLKFDVPLPEKMQKLGRQWREAIGTRPVWLAASTREGEEERVLDAWQAVTTPEALLVLVPRHPQRFDEVAALLHRRGLSAVRRSHALPEKETRVWLGDSMGEMVAYYTLADVAFIGGSLLPLGGQNLIEAAACGCPILVGPHTFNFEQATEDALGCGAAQRIANADELAGAINLLLASPEQRQRMRQAALEFAAAHRGATDRTMQLILSLPGC
ncbi:MAG: 3-deoxy-D-manno-octulosonic acid transferase [Betaproteobacteria bacterium ADurb.Bin341]|nr:MAG: 3-deoxy-D-manno-octulosonic acid transferase [Betaproteobacteria bacterium ADurb.Bin341]